MIHASPIIAASDVVEIRQPLPATQAHPQAAASIIEQAGTGPLNPFFFPSNPPRDRRDMRLTVFWSLLCAVPIAAVTIAIHVFR